MVSDDGLSKKQRRQRLIVAEISANATIRTSTLAQLLNVTPETIRRDIEELTRQGIVRRTYGGAAGAFAGLQPIFEERSAIDVEERRKIAENAAALVEPNSVIMIDSGSTTTLFAQALSTQPKKFTVISNSLGVLGALAGHPDARLILCPGDYSRRERAVYGPETLAFLNRFNVDAAYIGASGMMADGPVDVETDAVWVKRTMLSRAKTSVLLASSIKIGRPYLAVICPWQDIDVFITDKEITGSFQDVILSSNIRVVF